MNYQRMCNFCNDNRSIAQKCITRIEITNRHREIYSGQMRINFTCLFFKIRFFKYILMCDKYFFKQAIY